MKRVALIKVFSDILFVDYPENMVNISEQTIYEEKIYEMLALVNSVCKV